MTVNTAYFFEVTLPYYIERHLFIFNLNKGRIHFIVGTEEWTIVFGDVAKPILRGLRGWPDLALRFTPEAFVEFCQGDLDERKALREKTVEVRGEHSLIGQLWALFSPPPFKAPLGLG